MSLAEVDEDEEQMDLKNASKIVKIIEMPPGIFNLKRRTRERGLDKGQDPKNARIHVYGTLQEKPRRNAATSQFNARKAQASHMSTKSNVKGAANSKFVKSPKNADLKIENKMDRKIDRRTVGSSMDARTGLERSSAVGALDRRVEQQEFLKKTRALTRTPVVQVKAKVIQQSQKAAKE